MYRSTMLAANHSLTFGEAKACIANMVALSASVDDIEKKKKNGEDQYLFISTAYIYKGCLEISH